MKENTVLVTGAAGFIGFHLCRRLLDQGLAVVGFDNLNDYYSVSLKEARLQGLHEYPRFTFVRGDISHEDEVEELFSRFAPGVAVNLAAQAGVRYSIDHPRSYIDSNIVGFFNVLEAARRHPLTHLLYASSSSVYGDRAGAPFRVEDRVDQPVSLYAATKKSNELMAYTYSHLFGIPVTGLRFFTVYGPWGRPDMAYFKFTKAILEGTPIDVYAGGELQRDYTYVDDIVSGISRLMGRVPQPDETGACCALYNIGNQRPETVLSLIQAIEAATGKTAQMRMLPMQPGDVHLTCADVSPLRAAVGFSPDTPLGEGIARFVDWYIGYYGSSAGT